ncbi:MAG: hypothetical protein Q7S55_01460 [Nanoarchaeota archaeon]|nr:hypothetical protein [Nanoarchaeota archaeon]
MKGTIISFIGTDGAGKSTIIAELKKKLESGPSTKVKTVYFGWRPFLPTTKLLSFILKKKNYQIADKMNSNSSKEHRFSLFQEIMLGYYYIEYLSRYIFQLRLSSSKSITLVDRYFYDMYAHYRYAEQSRILPTLLKIMPKPYLTFFLTVDIQTAKERKPEMDLELLQEHYHRYQKLSKLIDAKIVKTDQQLEQSVDEILNIIKEKNNSPLTS